MSKPRYGPDSDCPDCTHDEECQACYERRVEDDAADRYERERDR